MYLNHASWIERIQFTSSSYESLKAVGIDIISSDSLRADIANLFGNEFPFKTMWLRDAGLVNAEFFIPFLVKFFEVSNETNPAESNFHVSRLVPVDYDSLLKSQEFINALSRRKGLKVVIVDQLKILQNYIEETIISIQNEFENF